MTDMIRANQRIFANQYVHDIVVKPGQIKAVTSDLLVHDTVYRFIQNNTLPHYSGNTISKISHNTGVKR